jgi:hypothetical protein
LLVSKWQRLFFFCLVTPCLPFFRFSDGADRCMAASLSSPRRPTVESIGSEAAAGRPWRSRRSRPRGTQRMPGFSRYPRCDSGGVRSSGYSQCPSEGG